jgi:dihydrofolate reductase
MTRTQYYVAASIDGYIADGDGRLDWLFQFNDVEGVEGHYKKFLAGVGALAMGARTYEFLLAEGQPWPYVGLPTWVFTHRGLPGLAGADIRCTAEDVAVVHAAMVRAAAGKHVWLVGGGELVAQFVARGLLDELHLCVVPVVLGGGAPLLPVAVQGALALAEVTRFPRGLTELRYDLPVDRLSRGTGQAQRAVKT